MAASKNYYEVLGVAKTADLQEIKRAYKKLARQYHPDLNPNNKDAEAKFKEISEAYAVLSDTTKRAQYDRFGSGNFGNDFERAWGQSKTQGGGFDPNKMGDFGFDLGDIFGDILMGGAFGSSRSGRNRSRGAPPQDAEMELPLSFLESIEGAKKSLKVGSSLIDVKIPKGVETGSKIRVAGQGQNGGDLYLIIRVQSHAFFKRQGLNVELSLPISLKEAIAGASVAVPTVSGAVDLKVPAGASSGMKLKLKGKGLEDSKSKERGDQIVTLQVVLPKFSDSDRKKVLDALSSIPEDPSVRSSLSL